MVVYLVIIAIIFLAFLCKRDKIVFGLLMGLMFIIMGFCTDNADFKNYERLYNYMSSTSLVFNRSTTSIEAGVVLIFYLCKSFLHFEFQETLILICILGLILIGRAVLKYTEYPTLVLALYFIAPFFPCDVIQIRNFIAEGIVLNAILELFSKGKRTNKDFVRYILLVMLACFFHISSIFFVLIILVDIIKDKKIFTICIYSFISLIAVFPKIITYLPFIPLYKVEKYMSGAAIRSNPRDLLLLVVVVVEILMNKYLLKHYEWSLKNYDFVERVYKVHILLTISVAMILFFDSAFYRLPRNLLLLDYVVVSKYIYKYQGNYNRGILIFYVFAGLLWSTVNVFSEWNVILKNNMILQFLW